MALAVFIAAAVISLGTSWLLVSRLERVSERLGFSEALLGLVAALAADGPEITSAVTALVHHQRAVGSGVIIGSNVFNLAALLGVGSVVAGRIALHRKVVVLAGAVALWVAAVGGATLAGALTPAVGLGLALAVVVPSVVVAAVDSATVRRFPLPTAWALWLASAVEEEATEVGVAVRPRRGTRGDVVTAAGALVVIVSASVVMERAASAVGQREHVAGIVVGGLVLAAVTSLPNTVAGVYLAGRGRGAALLSTTMSSNTFNIVFGLLVPATALGVVRVSGSDMLIVAWYGALTVVTLACAGRGGGLRRRDGWLVIAGYVGFVVTLLVVA